MSAIEEVNKIPHSPRTKGVIQYFEGQVKLHIEGLENNLQVTNDKLGQLMAMQIATTDKLTKVEASVASVDKILAALLNILIISTQ